MVTIKKSVGRGGSNQKSDAEAVQKLLNLALPSIGLVEDGKVGKASIAAIDYFQASHMRIKPDGRIDPSGVTLKSLNKAAEKLVCVPGNIDLPAPGPRTRLTKADYQHAVTKLGCELAAIQAVSDVESKGAGFFPSGRPAILFEAHIFSRKTFHCFDKLHPTISSKSANKKLYVGGDAEYDRLANAMALDRQAALLSASWGRFQIMGFNHAACGYATVEQFVGDMFDTEGKHLNAFVEFVKSSKLTDALKNKQWATFAARYNGPAYAENAYDTKMAAAYKKYSSGL